MYPFTVNISDLKEVPEFKKLYVPQPVDDLMVSYKQDGQVAPIFISENNEIIDGYRRVEAIKIAGGTTVRAQTVVGESSIYTRILLNKARVTKVEDTVTIARILFKRFPKRQGKKSDDGEKYVRDQIMSSFFNNRYKGDDIIRKLEYILDNDIEGDKISRGIFEQNWKVDPCYTFLKDKLAIDRENNYGFAERIVKGEISVTDANKMIDKKFWLDTEFKHSFVIPEKGNAFNMDCVEIAKIPEFKNSVDLLFTSPPYFILRKYSSPDSKQIGQEKTKEEYCENLANNFGALVPTLKESANVIINIGETYDDGVGYGIPQLLKHYIEKNTSLIYKDTLIWSKPNPKPQNENIKRPINNIEYLLWFVVNPPKAKYNLVTYPKDDPSTPISHGCKDVDKNGVVWDKNISLTMPYKKIASHLKEQEILGIINATTGKNHEVYRILEEGHPAIMSPLLPILPIMMTTDEGDRVFDCFGGSNVVGRMSLLLNRRALSTELEKQYFNVGCRMLEEGVKDFDRAGLNYINRRFYNNNIIISNQFKKVA